MRRAEDLDVEPGIPEVAFLLGHEQPDMVGVRRPVQRDIDGFQIRRRNGANRGEGGENGQRKPEGAAARERGHGNS